MVSLSFNKLILRKDAVHGRLSLLLLLINIGLKRLLKRLVIPAGLDVCQELLVDRRSRDWIELVKLLLDGLHVVSLS